MLQTIGSNESAARMLSCHCGSLSKMTKRTLHCPSRAADKLQLASSSWCWKITGSVGLGTLQLPLAATCTLWHVKPTPMHNSKESKSKCNSGKNAFHSWRHVASATGIQTSKRETSRRPHKCGSLCSASHSAWSNQVHSSPTCLQQRHDSVNEDGRQS